MSGIFLVTEESAVIYYHLNLTAMLGLFLAVLHILMFRKRYNDVYGPIERTVYAINVLDMLHIDHYFPLSTTYP